MMRVHTETEVEAMIAKVIEVDFPISVEWVGEAASFSILFE
jgi:hypothetical protein